MKLHEYQAKEIMKSHGVPVDGGVMVETHDGIAAAVEQVREMSGADTFVVKAQIHAGGRGKAGGVKVVSGVDSAVAAGREILGKVLVTPQTGPAGREVQKIFITPAVSIVHEYYLAVTMDRARERPVIIASSEGGVEIEEVARTSPEKVIKEWIDPVYGLLPFQSRRIALGLGWSGDVLKQGIRLIHALVRTYAATDASLVEVNPLVLTSDDQLLAIDAKFNLDDNALYRQKEIAAMRDLAEEDPAEVEASDYGLNYVKLDGAVGCMVNGAGLAMATMDIIKLKGGEPANFLDVGGGASVETVKNGFRIILSDDNVKAVLVNIFGGIVRCDRVANGIVEAVKELDLDVPVVVRLEGTNAAEAREILANSGVKITPATSFDDAADKVVAAAG